jgi:hypothetical protein
MKIEKIYEQLLSHRAGKERGRIITFYWLAHALGFLPIPEGVNIKEIGKNTEKLLEEN